jgi:hypothetical protein
MVMINLKGFQLKKCGHLQLFVLILICYVTPNVQAQPPHFPVPAGNPKQLFFLQRTPNTNTIVCELNLDNGKLKADEPVHVFWLRYQEKGQRQELNYIQRTFAYGMKVRKAADNNYEMYFVSFKRYKIYLQLGSDGKYHAYAMINKRFVILSSIYLHINGGSFWKPNVEYADLSGIDPVTAQVVKERMPMK